MFENLQTDTTIEEQGDSLGGNRVLDSGLYDFDIDIAYIGKSKGGAMSLNLVLIDGNTELKQTLWITGGDAKGNKNYYMDAKSQKQYLPGFSQANALCLLSLGKELGEVVQSCEEKVIKLYDFDTKKELPTKVDMVMGLLGQKITVGVVKQTVDKTAKDGKGDYVPTGETRDENDIDKMFRHEDKMTVAEIRAKADVATFHESWATKWNGQVKMKAKGAPGGAKAGAGGEAAATSSLFQ